ncbi:LytTR family transcriptional regulator DNA-binding domain-containing protein [Petrimonas sp.]|uniref:LytTR family transcriptional regulator DNA-binding domain-containing protein n=1 Tax=Petrimonas sp. TaxID=2023866 RepID=UPI003F50D4BD
MSVILTILRRPHPGYPNFKVYFQICSTIALGVFLTLSILQPFNMGDRNILGNPFLTALVYAGGAYAATLINSVWINFFPRSFSNEKWTVGREIILCLYQLICVASAIWLINYFRGSWSPRINSYSDMLWIVTSVGFFPYVTALLIRNIYLLKNRMQKAAKMNISLILDNKEPRIENASQYINLRTIDRPIEVDAFISAESKSDYLVVNIAKNGKLEQLNVNTTLEEFETENAQLNQLFRCHDKFLINRNRIIWIEGNAAGFKLLLHHDLPAVCVSRERAEELKKRLKVARLA